MLVRGGRGAGDCTALSAGLVVIGLSMGYIVGYGAGGEPARLLRGEGRILREVICEEEANGIGEMKWKDEQECSGSPTVED